MTFDSVVGQSCFDYHFEECSKRAASLAHAYPFCGPRGVGKLRCARIFAKAINCEHPNEADEA